MFPKKSKIKLVIIYLKKKISTAVLAATHIEKERE
jgi:hypothetical protein